MKYYIVEPEVPGNIADSEFIDKSARPPVLKSLKFVFDGWLGDDIVESIMTYAVTERLMQHLKKSSITGIEFELIEVTTSDQFSELQGSIEIPNFYWMKIIGEHEIHDICRSQEGDLLVSKNALDVMNEFNLDGADIAEC